MATTTATSKKQSKKVPAKKATSKKTIIKKTTAKKAPVKKPAVKKVSTKAVKKDINKAKKEIVEAVDAVEDVVETAAETVFARVNKNVDQARGVARQSWLAYLGVIGRTYDEVVSRTEKASEDIKTRIEKFNDSRLDLVEDLVVRGEKVQDEAEAKLKESRANVEEQIEIAKERLVTLTTKVDVSERLQGLSNRLESLSKDLRKSA